MPAADLAPPAPRPTVTIAAHSLTCPAGNPAVECCCGGNRLRLIVQGFRDVLDAWAAAGHPDEFPPYW